VTALQHYFEQEYDGPVKVGFMLEPVDAWDKIRDRDGRTMLQKYYADQQRYAFSFQMMAYVSRLAILRECMRQDYDVIVLERSVFTDCQVFAKMLFDEGKIEDVEYAIYCTWFDEFLHDISPVQVIYLQTAPEIAAARIQQRARQGEETIPLAYLTNCHDYHERWLQQHHAEGDHGVLTINANEDIQDQFSQWLEQVRGFLQI
jgi:deoxyadenosine/deoxycytidine kinase